MLSVIQAVATNPTNITYSVSNNVLTLEWPLDHTGWRLEVQTNLVGQGLGTNWSTVASSTNVNQLTFPVDLLDGSVFYRLVYP